VPTCHTDVRGPEGEKGSGEKIMFSILFVLLTKKETRIVGARLPLPQMRDPHCTISLNHIVLRVSSISNERLQYVI
jgi:hypothetical protein